MAEFDGVLDAGPWLRLFGRHEAARAGGGSAVGNAAEGAHFILHGAANLAGGGFDDGTGRIAGGGRGPGLRERAAHQKRRRRAFRD